MAEQSSKTSNCPDCGGGLLPIKVIDRGTGGDELLRYASAHSKPDMRGRYSDEGSLLAYACSECGRVFWYASKILTDHMRPDPGESAVALENLASGMFDSIEEEI